MTTNATSPLVLPISTSFEEYVDAVFRAFQANAYPKATTETELALWLPPAVDQTTASRRLAYALDTPQQNPRRQIILAQFIGAHPVEYDEVLWRLSHQVLAAAAANYELARVTNDKTLVALLGSSQHRPSCYLLAWFISEGVGDNTDRPHALHEARRMLDL